MTPGGVRGEGGGHIRGFTQEKREKHSSRGKGPHQMQVRGLQEDMQIKEGLGMHMKWLHE